VQVRPFIERCPHNPSADAAGAAAMASSTFPGLRGAEPAVGAADRRLYRASRIARTTDSLLIVESPDEL
jgi:hypothetical protein